MNRYDDRKNYCRMLGHHVTFQYCRTTTGDTPCRKIFDCWFELLPIEDYMNQHYRSEDLLKAFKPPESKVSTLLDLIAKAKNRT